MNRIVLTGLASLFSFTTLAQPPAVTVTTREPPYIYLASRNNAALAPITITETSPDSLQDGFISLMGIDNAEQNVQFSAATTVTGSVTGHRRAAPFDGGGYFVLMISVDTDDSRIDTITINPVVTAAYDSSWNLFTPMSLQLRDGHPMLLDETPAGPGVGLGATVGYHLGTYIGSGDIEIGASDTLTLAPNQTVTLPHNDTHPSFGVIALNSAVVSVDSFSATHVTVTGHAPGQTRLHASNPSGRTGVLYVNVVAPSTPEPTTPEPPPIVEEPPPVMPVLETTTIEGRDVNGVISAGVLPRGSREFRNTVSANEVVTVAGEIAPAPNQVGQFAELFTVVKVTNPEGYTAWFQKDATGRFVPWNGQLAALVPVQEAVLLSDVERLEVFEGRLVPGEYHVFFGYWADNSSLIYSKSPLAITVRASP